jgi:hypothetical protein
MDIIIDLLVSIEAGVIVYYLCKLLDRGNMGR